MNHLQKFAAGALALLSSTSPAIAGVHVLLSDNGAGLTDVIPRLQMLGHNVTVSDASTWNAAFDYAPYDVVVFEYSSANPADIPHLVAAVDSGLVGVVAMRATGSESTLQALGLTGGATLNYQDPTDLNVLDNTHCITAGLSLGVQNLGFTYMTNSSDPGANTTILGSGPSAAALIVHNTRRAAVVPFYGHPTNYGGETAASMSITDRALNWAGGNAGCVGSVYCSSNLNSTGGQAAISASGSHLISDNNLTLRAQPVPNQTFLFFHGPNQVDTPFGNGRMCVGGGITRINPPGIASGNVAERAVDLSALGLAPGTHTFQCWFRDTAAGGSSFNTSNAVSVNLLP